MNMEQNKILGALLVVGIMAYGLGYLTDALYHNEIPEKNAYYIEVDTADTVVAGEVKSAGPEPIAELIATADITKGQKLSRACAACHSFDQGGSNGIGPNLWGVFGRAKASKGDFAYSDALKGLGGSWDEESLNGFLWKPKKYAAGTKMNYIGLKKTEDRAAMVAWLKTLK